MMVGKVGSEEPEAAAELFRELPPLAAAAAGAVECDDAAGGRRSGAEPVSIAQHGRGPSVRRCFLAGRVPARLEGADIGSWRVRIQ
jgi:hypothetical protein